MVFVTECTVADLVEPSLSLRTYRAVHPDLKFYSKKQYVRVSEDSPRVVMVAVRIYRRSTFFTRMEFIMSKSLIILLLVAFYECTAIEKFTIPDNVKCIGNYAFYKCSGIQKINLPVADKVNPEKMFFSTIYNTEEVEENGTRLTDIKTYMKEARAKFATGMWDINDDAQWQNYLDSMDKMGLQMVIENTQAAVDRAEGK